MTDERKEPIWKKEISFGRKPDGGDSSADTGPKRAIDAELEAIKAAAVAAVTPDPPRPEPARRPTKPLPPEPEETPEPVTQEAVWVEPEVESVPFWKREIGKSKTPKAAKELKAKKEPKAKKQPIARDAEAKPFWKKELSLSRSSTPKEKKVKPENAAKPEKDASTPFWKRDVAVGKRKPTVAKAKKQKEKKAPSDKPKREGLKLKMPRLERPARAKRGSHVPKRLVGLKIGASQLAAARVSNNGSAELLQVAREELEPGIIVGGELREPELLADALREFFRSNNLPKRNVRLGIANNRIGVRSFEIVGIDDPKQLDNAIRFRAQEALPIPIEEAVLDYQILGESQNEEGETVKRVLLVVAYRELVLSLIHI